MNEETKGRETVYVNEFTDGVLDPEKPMLGPVKDGGHIIANTAPGCWGPMITPELRGGHEVTIPVEVEGAEIGDAIAIRIKEISVTSVATSSGNDYWVDGLYMGDPYVAKYDPDNKELNPESYVEGIGEDAVKFKSTGKPASPFKFTNGYTIAFDNNRSLGVTLDKSAAEKIAHDAKHYAAMPQNAIQHSVLTFCPHHLVGLVARLRPFMGQLGTCPSIAMPDSHNAGDFGTFLVGAPHPQAITAEDLKHRTDGHMDIDAVRAGSILICPVKVPGGGVYMGDMHAMQGDGEIAGHTTDVSGTVTLQVHVLKGLDIDGPIIFPVEEDLPFLAKPISEEERSLAEKVAKGWGMSGVEDSVPISIVGSGPDLNAATENGLERAAELLGVPVPEIRNRATITGSIEIGRHPGVVQVTFLAPSAKLDELGLLDLANDQY
ncbi:MAG: acetamidase/formamidase family protein [Candidatus Thalassarchaeaceae archaeon]|nr:acetamidase/formamidase family protein [Candidatus Thalassarchaeaceae archaeon]